MLAATPAHSDERWASVRVPAEVRAGATLEIELGAAPRDVDEFELLVSLDDGRTWPVRASRELEAGERVIRWRVPNLPASSARLRLRYARDEREIDGPASAAFRIVGGAGPQQLKTFHEGNWWEGLESGASGGQEMLAPNAPPSLSAASSVQDFEAPGPGVVAPSPDVTAFAFGSSGSFSSAPPPACHTSPRFRPLRN